MTTLTTKRFTARGRPTIVYDDAGDPDAPPVVLLHGGVAADRRGWFEVMPRLATEFRVLAMDLRGHGESERSPGDYAVEDFSADVEAFATQIARAPVALVGHSMGGMIAAHVAGTQPDLVSRVFFEDAPLSPSGPGGASPPRRFRRRAFREHLEAQAATTPFVELFGAASAEGLETGALWPALQELFTLLRDRGMSATQIAQSMGDVPRLDGTGTTDEDIDEANRERFVTALLAADPSLMARDGIRMDGYDPARPMACPVHMLRADPSVGPPPVGACFLPEHEAPFLATHPRATVEFVPGVGHGIHLERPAWFTDRLMAFLAASSSVTSGGV